MKTPLRLLLIEDSQDDAVLLLREISKEYQVTHCIVETEEDLQRALSTEKWDLVVSDYSLPGFAAPRALELTRAVELDVPFLIVSGTIGEQTAVAAMRAGANDFMTKGHLSRLLPAIARELREAQGHRARRKAEAELRTSEHRYRSIVETTNECVLQLNADLSIEFANGRLATVMGKTVADLIGCSFFDLLPAASTEIIRKKLEHLNESQSVQFEVQLGSSGGRYNWFLLDASRQPGCTGLLVLLMDVGQRRQLEDQLRQAQKMEAIGSLAGGVAHDFNNLLSVILSYTGLMLGDLPEADPMRFDVDEIRKAGERARDLTSQLLAFSRKQLIEPRTLDLNDIIFKLEKMLRRLLGEHLEVSFFTEQDLGFVEGDPGQMEQVLMNLLVNARDALPSGGRLTVETKNVYLGPDYAATHHDVPPGPYVMLAVSDNGVGMDAATVERIFEPFFTTKSNGSGTGLGLSTVFGIVKQSGGHIWVYSEPGKGTTFKVFFPRSNGEVHDGANEPYDPISLRGSETILLVEDEEQVRAAARTILQRQGYEVLDAANGGDALEASEKHAGTIHLLLTDVVMPRMSGKELSARLRLARPNLSVIFMSGYTENTVIHHGVLDPGIKFLPKPITPETLARKVREVLDQPVVNAGTAQ